MAQATRPRFKRCFHVEVVDGEGVYLVSDRKQYVLQGELARRLAPLLDGTRGHDEIVAALADEDAPERTRRALAKLVERGYVVEAGDAAAPRRAAFWESLGLDGDAAERRVRAARVELVTLGVDGEPFRAAAARLGLPLDAREPELSVVVVDDYLNEGLEAVNAAALENARPWLLVKPAGSFVWVGPVFRPGEGACWRCLAQRLRANRQVETYVEERLRRPLPVADAALPASVAAAVELAALEAAKFLAGARALDHLVTLDLATLAAQTHTLVRRPQCPACGDAALVARQA